MIRLAPLPAAVGAAALVLGGAALGRWHAAAAPHTELDFVACGIGAAPPSLRLPTAILTELPSRAPVRIGPLAVPGVNEPVSVAFVAVASESEKRATRENGEIRLPVVVGEGGRVPRTVTLNCRYGDLTAAVYAYDGERVQLAISPPEPKPS